MEWVMGIEPMTTTWKAMILPLNYTRKKRVFIISIVFITFIKFYRKYKILIMTNSLLTTIYLAVTN